MSRGSPGPTPSLPPLTVLVIQADKYDWAEVMARAIGESKGDRQRPIKVVQTSWEHLKVGPCSNDPFLYNNRLVRYGTCQVTVSALFKDGVKEELSSRLFLSPDLVLIRNEVTAPHFNHRHHLLALLYANIPAVNSLKTILLNCDKPVMQSALHRVRVDKFRDRPDDFPLIPQDFYPSAAGFFYGHTFPAVVKFGSAHAGLGKIRVAHHKDMEDVRGLMPLMKDGFATAEPFIEAEKDLRIQKIGNAIRAYERRTISGSWKTNVGSSHVTEIPVTDQFKRWAEAAAVMFGDGEDDRMDILTVDAVVSSSGRSGGNGSAGGSGSVSTSFILEVNGTSSGLMEENAEEDNTAIAKLVLEKLWKIYPVKP